MTLTHELLAYALRKSEPEPTLLAELRRETHLKMLYPRMLSSPLQGRLLAFFSHLLKPRQILEIGTFTGYSCICMAEGLAEGGKITSIDKNEELGYFINNYLKKAGIENKVDVHFGPALDIIPTFTDIFDLIFIDADKANYLEYYQLVLPMLRPGGLILADNVLWSGKVIDESQQDKESRGIRAFNDFVRADEGVATFLLPMGDGLMMIWKK